MKAERHQLMAWLAGRPFHLRNDALGIDQCCPDFSCCQPELLVCREIRRAYLTSPQCVRDQFEAVFMAASAGWFRWEWYVTRTIN